MQVTVRAMCHDSACGAGRASCGPWRHRRLTVSGMNIKTALLLPAAASLAVATAIVASANPSDDAGEVASSPDIHGTVTVTATVAPEQCEPVAGGPTATEATDTGAQPGGPDAEVTEAADSTEGDEARPHGISTSRFDPYTCAPVPAAETTTTDKPSESAAGAGGADAPAHTFTPTLQKKPGDTSEHTARDPLSEPTTSGTLPPLPPLPGPGN